MKGVIKLVGMNESPYTRKMRSYLRYKRIPYIFYQPDAYGKPIAQLNAPKVALIPVVYFPQENYSIGHVDSTPLIRRIESEYDKRSILPKDPLLSFINDIVEDFADEWLTKAMMHYR